MPEGFRIKQMVDEMLVMQEALYRLPLSEVRAHIEAMEQHAIKLSRIASRLADGGIAPHGQTENAPMVA